MTTIHDAPAPVVAEHVRDLAKLASHSRQADRLERLADEVAGSTCQGQAFVAACQAGRLCPPRTGSACTR